MVIESRIPILCLLVSIFSACHSVGKITHEDAFFNIRQGWENLRVNKLIEWDEPADPLFKRSFTNLDIDDNCTTTDNYWRVNVVDSTATPDDKKREIQNIRAREIICPKLKTSLYVRKHPSTKETKVFVFEANPNFPKVAKEPLVVSVKSIVHMSWLAYTHDPSLGRPWPNTTKIYIN